MIVILKEQKCDWYLNCLKNEEGNTITLLAVLDQIMGKLKFYAQGKHI